MDTVYGTELLRWAAEQSRNPGWTPFWNAVAVVGAPPFFVVALPLLFAFTPSRFALRWTLAFCLSGALAEFLKQLFGRARPDLASFGLDAPLEVGAGGSFENAAFPSGHTLMTVAIWGVVAFHSRSRAVRVGYVVLVLLVGASRIALLRHDLLDVAGGLVIGAVLVAVLAKAESAWGAALAQLPRVERAGLWLLVAIVLQVSIAGTATALILGTGAGLCVGATMAAGRRRRARFPGLVRALARTALGLAGAFAAFRLVTPDGGAPPALLFAVYALVGMAVGGGLPLLLGGVWESTTEQS